MELGDVDRITADAVGEPGMRVFYIQARVASEVITVIVEKEQVQLLASSVLELLSDVERETGPGPGDDAMALEDPIDPRFRAGRLSIGYDGDLDRFVLEIAEYRPELDETEEEDEEEDPRDGFDLDAEVITLRATREQMMAMSRYGSAVALRGRPACQLCGNPMDPDGHVCPATNGHRTPRT
jgi:uncharacterized repeat protein (TIGR03847 family)